MLKFVHTADWQLGRPFKRFPEGLAERLRAARLDAIDRVAAHARMGGAGHVLVAGDVWDQETPATATLVQPLDRMRAADDLVWWLLPGNHDPHRPRGLWQRLGELGVPRNVRPCTSPAPMEMTSGAWLLPAPLASKRPDGDPTAHLGAMATPAGTARVGLAHGAIADFAEPGAAVIAADRATRAGLDYLALGDWHGRRQVEPRTWYAGTPEPDRFPRNDPGWCLVVALAGAGAAATVDARPTATFRWRTAAFDWFPGRDVSVVQQLAGDADVPADRTLLKLDLAGTVPLAARAELARGCARLAERVAHLDVDDSALATVVDATGLDRLGAEPGLRGAAEVLAGRAATDAAARRALDLLFTWALEA